MDRIDNAAAQGPTFDIGDIYYTLFRHKWKVLICTLLGFAGAVAQYYLKPPPYTSQARLFVRYVVMESTNIGPSKMTGEITKSPDMRGETIMNSELQILTSMDLAEEVARQVGPEKVLALINGGNNPLEAAAVIRNGLLVDAPRFSSVITITLSHPDPELAQSLLRGLIDAYFRKHVDIHRSAGMLGDFLTQETDQLRARLAQTEEELRKAKNQAGIVSLDTAGPMLANQINSLTQAIYATQAELAERRSELEVVNQRRPASGAAPTTTAGEPIPPAKISEYQRIMGRMSLLVQREGELLQQFTEGSPRVQELRTQLNSLDEQRLQLEALYPGLTARPSNPAAPGQSGKSAGSDPAVLAERIAALEAKEKVLNAQLEEVRGHAAKVDELEVTMHELRRRKELQEQNYRYYAATLEQSRINQALGDGKVSNVTEIETPTPAVRNWNKASKTIGAIAAGGLVLGLGWAFLIELLLDRSVRRPTDVQKFLRVPLFVSMPRFGRRQIAVAKSNREAQKLLGAGASGSRPPIGGSNPPVPVAAPDSGGTNPPIPTNGTGNGSDGSRSPLVPAVAGSTSPFDLYHETLRDRLISYFDSINLRHKPKLVAVTGIGHGAGVTSTAAGLARSFSETGEGNVLLVDMTQGQGSAQQFYRGNAVCNLEQILSQRSSAQIQDNLFVVGQEPSEDRVARILPQRFNKIVPKLKASDFDYIIFDMPPVSQISITPRLAGFMDMVLMVIESEKTDRELVSRAADLLRESKAHVGAVLNKTKTYVPARLHQENLPNI